MIIPADESNYGVNPLNEKTLYKAQKLTKGYDINIACLHWGREYLPYPSPEQKSIAQKILNSNFDLILGNHSHIPMKIDYFSGKPVIYSHGNFIFDQFYYDKPAQIINYHSADEKKGVRETNYLPSFVPNLTLKKWDKDSKISLVAEINISEDKLIDVRRKYIYFDQEKRLIDFLKEEEIEVLEKKLYRSYNYDKEFNKWKKLMKEKRVKEISFQYDSVFLRAYKIFSFILIDFMSRYNWFSKFKDCIKKLLKKKKIYCFSLFIK